MAKKAAKRGRVTKKAGRASADAKLQRWIDLLAALLTHRFGITVEQLLRDVPAYAASAKITSEASLLRTFERDKDELRALGIPIERRVNTEGEELGYYLDPQDIYLPFIALAGSTKRKALSAKRFYRSVPTLTFEPDELHAVFQCVELAGALGDPLLTAHCESAERKLRRDLPNEVVTSDDDEAARVAPRESVGGTLRELGKAMLRLKRVSFSYHTMGRDTTARRTVEPFGLFFQSGHWYLAGRDIEKEAIRNFRVSRIGDVQANVKTPQTSDYGIPAGFRLSKHAGSRKAWELGDGDAEVAIVEFHGPSGAVKAASALGAAVRNAARQRRFLVRRVDVFARWLLSFAGDAQPISPPSLVDAFDRIVKQTLAYYEATSA
ncbi:MAG: helix-turn-helix transcriptional regulator [Gemmatimonadaceae bacterium]